MAKYKNSSKKDSAQIGTVISDEAQENRMIALAINLAEQQLIDGTASAQVITHYLKLGSSKEKLEKEIMEKQKDMIEAKTKSLQATQHSEELYAEALKAMREYGGHNSDDNE